MRVFSLTSAMIALVTFMAACEASGPSEPTQLARVVITTGKTVDLGVSDELQLEASTSPGMGPVTWSSADANIAVVSPTGVVTARAIGSTMVMASSKRSTDTAVVSVHKPIGSVALIPESVSVVVGKAIQLSYRALDKSGEIVSLNPTALRWASNSTSIAAVSSTGRVQASGLGTTQITVDVNGKSSMSVVTVVPVPVASIAISPSPQANVNVGSATKLTATLKDSAGNVLTNRLVVWTSSDTSIVAVNSTGSVSGRGIGLATVRASAEGKTAETAVKSNRGVAASIAVTLTPATLLLGQTAQASATPRDSAGNNLTGLTITWSSNRPTVATVSPTGVVTAVAGGTASIVASADGATGVGTVTTTATPIASVSTVSVALASGTVAIGQATQATATARDSSGNVLTGRAVGWTSMNPSVATISSAGVVTAVAPGSATIKATVETKTGTTALVAGAPVIATLSVAFGSAALTAGQTTQAVAVALDSAGTLITGRPVTWTSLNPGTATVSSSGLVTAVTAGWAIIRATVDSKTADGTLTVTAATTPTTPPPTDLPVAASDAELPRVFLNTAVSSTPSSGRTLRVAAGGNLQRALDTAVAGDRILLAAGATFTGNFYLAQKPSGGLAGEWITVQSDGALPAEGTRVSPSIASSMSFPRLVSTTLVNTLVTQPGASKWRFMGIELTIDPGLSYNQGVINVGDASEAQNTLSMVPTDIIFDRVYVHGQPNVDLRKCVAFNSARTAIIDSYISECHSTYDAQAITGTNGPGPFKIVNNYLEGAAEGIAWGGGDPHIAGLVPADIEIRRNHFYKPLAWKSTQWLEKNIIESKNSTRVLVEGNVLENSWVGAQVGYTLALWSVNQDGTCAWCVTSHWTFRNNVIRNVTAGVNLTSMFSFPGRVNPIPMHHIVITNNVWIGMTGDVGRAFQIDTIPYTTIEHNTIFSPAAAVMFDPQGRSASLVIRNNIMGGYYGVASPWGSGSAAWNAVGGGTGSQWAANVVLGGSDWLNTIPWTYYATGAQIGFAGGANATGSTTATLDEMALTSSSPYKGKGTDGKDIGADIATIKTATAGVVRP